MAFAVYALDNWYYFIYPLHMFFYPRVLILLGTHNLTSSHASWLNTQQNVAQLLVKNTVMLHYHRGHGFESCSNLNLFQALFSHLFKSYIMWFKLIFGLKFLKSIDFDFSLSHIHYHNLKQKGNQNQTGLKNFKPKINLNHNIYTRGLASLGFGQNPAGAKIIIFKCLYIFS